MHLRRAFIRRFICIAAVWLCGVGDADATQNVSGPSVDAGKTLVEWRNGFEWDDESAGQTQRLRQLFLVDYGLSDILAVRATIRTEKLHHAEYHPTGFDADVRLQWVKAHDAGYALASRLTYAHRNRHGAADSFHLHTLADQKIDANLFRVNVVLSREVGGDAEESIAARAATQWLHDMTETLSAGMEWYGNAGNLAKQDGYSQQQHQIGPVAIWEFMPNTSMEMGYLQGISRSAPDHTVKVFVRRSF